MALFLDITLAILLVVTIIYAIVLNRRLGALRRDRSELEALAASFTEATSRADMSVGRLAKNATDLQARIDQARSLVDDLSFLTDRGEKTADRLEGAVRAGRDQGRDQGRNQGRNQAPNEPAAQTPAAPADTPQHQPQRQTRPDTIRPDPSASRDIGPVRPDLRPDLRADKDAGRDADDGARSEAERELLKALRSAS